MSFGGQRASRSESGCLLLAASFPPFFCSYAIAVLWGRVEWGDIGDLEPETSAPKASFKSLSDSNG